MNTRTRLLAAFGAALLCAAVLGMGGLLARAESFPNSSAHIWQHDVPEDGLIAGWKLSAGYMAAGGFGAALLVAGMLRGRHV